MTRSARLAASALAVAGVAVAARAFASPELDFGFGARSQALAGAGTAIADDAAAVFENPSGLARAEHVTVTLGYANVSYGLADDGSSASLPTVNALEGGLVVPGAILGVPVAFGLSLALPNGKLSELRQADASTSYWPLDDAGPRLVDVGTGFAARPLPELVLGAGVGFVASLRGTFGVHGEVVAADGQGAEYQSNLRHAVDADLTASRFPLVGVGWLPTPELAFGLAYRGAATVEHRIDAMLDGNLVVGDSSLPVRYSFESRSDVAYQPAQLSLGASLRPRPAWLVTAELDWQHYAPFPSPYTETSSHVALPPDAGLTVPDTVPVPAPAAHFRDRFVPRLGVEPRFALAPGIELRLRAGYAYERSPVPRLQTATRFLDLDRHVLAGGAGVEWATARGPFDALRLDLSIADALGVARTASTTAGADADRGSGHVLLVGATLGLVFSDPTR
ncbi:MAG TPA: outer membrane protein transport protein [Polyangiaceae bacterium]|nr:outer membrane protein transport protein [Polyangiaceae bacterium]